MHRFSSVLSVVFSLGFISVPLASSAQVMMTAPPANAQKSQESFAKFTPNPQKSTRIDYDTWDSLLEEMVLYSGPSARKRMTRPAPITGSRFSRGHTSAYRLEGNRIPYSQITNEFANYISDYKNDQSPFK